MASWKHGAFVDQRCFFSHFFDASGINLKNKTSALQSEHIRTLNASFDRSAGLPCPTHSTGFGTAVVVEHLKVSAKTQKALKHWRSQDLYHPLSWKCFRIFTRVANEKRILNKLLDTCLQLQLQNHASRIWTKRCKSNPIRPYKKMHLLSGGVGCMRTPIHHHQKGQEQSKTSRDSKKNKRKNKNKTKQKHFLKNEETKEEEKQKQLQRQLKRKKKRMSPKKEPTSIFTCPNADEPPAVA